MLRISAFSLAAGLFFISAAAAEAAITPAIRTSAANQVPACVTPDRLMDFVRSRNKKLAKTFADIAHHYKTHGEALGVRWDYAFYQMILETNSLRFHRPNGKPGDVSPKQNNFAGLGATGRRARGESFRDVSSGVLAHLQHIRLYSGDPVADPIAERTRKVRDIILPWAKSLGRPVTYTDLGSRWAAKSRHYAAGLNAIADAYAERYCADDEVVQPSVETTASIDAPETTEGKTEKTARSQARSTASDMVKATVTASGEGASETGTKTHMAALSTSTPTLPAPAGCKVFTASYGGAKSLLIQSTSNGLTHYTALTVHEGKEAVQAEAFINAYAQGGATIAEFASTDEALAKAFQLCPEN